MNVRGAWLGFESKNEYPKDIGQHAQILLFIWGTILGDIYDLHDERDSSLR